MDGTNERRPSNLETRGRGYNANGTTTIAWWLWEENMLYQNNQRALAWDAKGYGDLGLSSQSLRDQAAGLEKTQRAGEQGKFTMRCTDGGRGKFKSLRWGKPVQGRTFRWKFGRFYNFVYKRTFISSWRRETESQYGNLLTISSQDLLREGRITQGRIGKLKASEPSDRS